MTFIGWFDPDMKKSTAAKLQAGCDRYVEKFKKQPTHCLTSIDDARDLANQRILPVHVEPRSYIARNVFYIGEGSGAYEEPEDTYGPTADTV